MSLSRRRLLEAGAVVLAGTALAPAAANASPQASVAATNEAVVRAWYKLWVTRRDWAPFDALVADDFTFSSTNGEDHISKAAFKQTCWAPNINLTKGFDLELMMAKGDEVFVKYLGHATNGKSFRNVELLRVRNGKIESIECYFGAIGSFQSAATKS